VAAGADLVEGLEAVGLTHNEALAYVTLLEFDGAATGYEVANRSGIPRSAVYTVLRRLEQAGGAFATGADPARYAPTDPPTFVGAMRAAHAARFDRLGAALAALPKRTHPEPVWILDRYEEVLGRADAMIRGATSAIHLSVWPREIAALSDAFEAVADRPIHRVLHCPVPLPHPPRGFSAWCPPGPPDAQKAAWSHKVRVVRDRAEALIGGIEPAAVNRAVWTTNPSLVDLAADALVLDLTLLAASTGRDATRDVAPMMRPHL
jgi:hypothetical protein